MTHKLAQRQDRVAQMLEDVAAYHCIERVAQHQSGEIALDKGYLREPGGLGARSRYLQDRRVVLHANHHARWANQLGCEQGHITCTTAYLEHLHPGTQPGLLEELPGHRCQDLGELLDGLSLSY